MRRGARSGLALPLAALLIGGCDPVPVRQPSPARADPLGAAFSAASEAEQTRPAADAVEAYIALVDRGLAAGDDGLGAVLAGLDALVWRDSIGLGRAAQEHALAFRGPGAMARVKGALAALYDRGGAPFARGFVAQAELDLVRYEGDAERAALWRARTGAARAATVVGPLAWAALSAVEAPTALEAGPILASYPGFGAFAAEPRPVELSAEDGVLDVTDVAAASGLYGIVVDVTVPQAETISLAVQSTATAALVVGGKVATTRPYALGGSPVLRLATASVPAGTVRVVVRLGVNEDGGHVALLALGPDGAPLPTSAPKPGAPAGQLSTATAGVSLDRRYGDASLDAAALLALGDVRGARTLLEERPATGPLAALLFARAVSHAEDIPENKRIERARSAYERALSAWPTSWEAALGKVVYAAARKGSGEGRVESLRELARLRAEGKSSTDPMMRAFEASTAAEVSARDLALAAFDDVKGPLAGTPALAALDARVHPRVGAEAEAYACGAPGVDRQSLDCLQQRARRGDSAGVKAEIARLRELRGAPGGLWQSELSRRVTDGDAAGALQLYDALLPGQRTLALLGLVARSDPAGTRMRLSRDSLTARDAPAQIDAILRLLGDDPAVALEAEGARAVAADRAQGGASTAATLVLLHDESYTLGAGGLLHAVIHDLRRVAGTTDVDQNPSGGSYVVTGREIRHTLRRLVYKKDGRVLEPDKTQNASQGNADLSQLEPGDYVEQIVEGFALPDRAGQIVVDTADLLPERTSVRRASVELRAPKGVALARWAHPALGTPTERDDGASRVVRYELRDAPPRRIEPGAPRMDQGVGISFGTYTWPEVARYLGEEARAFSDDDPFVARWAEEAAGQGASPNHATVERVVLAAGRTVKVAQGNVLSDGAAAGLAGPQQYGAREIIELGQGSRSWLVYRALTALHIPAEIVVAEREPFSADPNFPARPGRFEHPLVIAHPPDGDLWIDADVVGPPLPAGQVSPELRGRSALRASGQMIPVEGAANAGGADEVELRLAVDARGDATGTFSIVIRGRPAQGLADALQTVVGSERRDMLRGVVLGWLPWANVDDVTLSSAEGSWEISLHAGVSIPSFAQGEGRAWVLPGLEPLHAIYPRPAVSTVSSVYATQLGRQSALAIDSAFQYRVHRQIDLPEGAHVSAPPPSLSVQHERLSASRSGKVEGQRVDETFTLSLSTGTVAAAAYEKFAREAKRVDDAFLAGTKVSR